MSKHSVISLGLRVVTTCWSWARSNRTSPSNGVGLDCPLAACSLYGDLTCFVHTVNNLCLFICEWHTYLYNWGPYVRLVSQNQAVAVYSRMCLLISFIHQTFLNVHTKFQDCMYHNSWEKCDEILMLHYCRMRNTQVHSKIARQNGHLSMVWPRYEKRDQNSFPHCVNISVIRLLN